MLRFTTAGESHGPALISILEGIPAGLPLLAEHVNAELARRQQGYGRGRRMQIERDEVEFLGGVRAGETIGSPIAMLIRNRDWENWQEIMDPAPREAATPTCAAAPSRASRPGHADLTGLLKYDRDDARDILERASARETTARVAAAAVCSGYWPNLAFASEATSCTSAASTRGDPMTYARRPQRPRRRIAAAHARRRGRARDDRAHRRAKREGNTLGGICEVVCDGLPVGLGSHVSWDRKLDGRLGAAIMSIPAVKGVEIGIGFEAARAQGSEVHDEIVPAPASPCGARTPSDEPRRGPGGGHDHGGAARRARRDEADQHPHASARYRRS